jgi:L-iditol 2-dehydrogenase
METMKAWRLHAYGDHRYEDVPLPEVRPGWVLVKVKVVQAAIVEAGHMEGMPHKKEPRITKMLAEGTPVTLGHEFCGMVAEVGAGVTSLRVGDRVSTPATFPCRACDACRAGKRCRSRIALNVDIPGAFAEYVCMPDHGLVKIPDGPTDNEVATMQPLLDCLQQVRSAEIRLGEAVAIIGQGAMGLGCLQIARSAGAGLVIAVDTRPEALELGRAYGADVVVDAGQVDPVEEVRRLTEDGVDVVFEEAGGRSKDGLAGFTALNQAMRMVAEGGRVIQAANLDGRLDLDPVFMRGRRMRYIFPGAGRPEDFLAVASMVASGRVRVAPQISHVVHGLDRLPEAMEITINKGKYRATNPAQIEV